MRQRLHINTGTLKAMISNWKKREYIEEYGEIVPKSEIARQLYTKTSIYLKDHVSCT